MKICIPILSRQAFGRLEPLIKEIDQSHHELSIIVGGAACISQYGDVREQLKADSTILFRPPDDSTASMAFATGMAIQELVWEFKTIQPDLVFTHADRYETLAVAIAASYMNIPLAHTQGGEHTGSIDNKVRFAISQLADYHFTATKKSAQTLLSMGLDHVYNVGCPSIDLAKHIKKTEHMVGKEQIFQMLNYYGTGHKISEDYLLVVYHPDTTLPKELIHIELDELYLSVKDHTAVWMLPNIDAHNEMISKTLRQYRDHQSPTIRFITNLPANDYLHVLNHCTVAVGNSSSFIREGSYLGVPAILIGHRQHNRELGPNIQQTIPPKIKDVKKTQCSHLYGDGTASKKIMEIINGI